MSSERSLASVSAAARRAFEAAERRDWSGGVPIEELLNRVNAVAGKFLPNKPGPDSRVSREFTPRSFRRYQTMGCISPPVRDGKRVVYGFGHFVQSLLVRKLLWQGMPAEMISDLVGRKGIEEVKRMLFGDSGSVTLQGECLATEGYVGGEGTWRRILLAPGIELHIGDDATALTKGDSDAVIRNVRELLASLQEGR